LQIFQAALITISISYIYVFQIVAQMNWSCELNKRVLYSVAFVPGSTCDGFVLRMSSQTI